MRKSLIHPDRYLLLTVYYLLSIMTDFDLKMMGEALEEAFKGSPFTHPNPLVGCVLVKKGKIIARGHHALFGGPHAEVNAVKNSKMNVKGASLYVTMEPCSTYGKTPPCTELIVKSGIKKVFIGDLDPNPDHNGRALALLKKSGIETEAGLRREECRALNRAFYKNMKDNLPYITIKFAESVNGKIANHKGRSRWISCFDSQVESHKLRAESDCVLAGINTVLKDNPSLNVRHSKFREQPYACIMDPELKTPLTANIFKAGLRGVFIVTSAKNLASRKAEKYSDKAKLIGVKGNDGFLDVKEAVRKLYKHGVRHILVEGGGNTLGQFVYHGLFDRIFVYFAPLVIGDKNAISSVIWPDNFKVDGLGLRLAIKNHKKIGEDLIIELGKAA